MGFIGRMLMGATALAIAASAIPAYAETVDEAVPFLADDAAYPDAPLPRRVWSTQRRAPEADDEDPAAWGRPLELPAPPPFPDLTALLAPYRGACVDEGDVVRLTVDHPLQPRIERLLAAVRVGYTRDTRVELTLQRGDERLVELDATTRPGALLLDDSGTLSQWPAGISASPVLAIPVPIEIRTGTRLAVSVVPIGGDRLLVEIDLHHSAVVGDRTFDDSGVRRVAPVLDVVHLRITLPAVSGEPTSVSVAGLEITVRATRSAATPPAGTRVLPLRDIGSRALPEALRIHPRRLWNLEGSLASDDEDDAFTRRSRGVAALPREWVEAADAAGVRLTLVPPGLAVADGDEAALVRFDERLADGSGARAQVIVDGDSALSLPTVRGRPFSSAVARLVPQVVDVTTEVQTARAAPSSRLAFDVAGTFVHGEWSGDALAITLVERVIRDPRTVDARPRLEESGGASNAAVVDGSTFHSTTRSVRLTDDDAVAGAVRLAEFQPWR